MLGSGSSFYFQNKQGVTSVAIMVFRTSLTVFLTCLICCFAHVCLKNEHLNGTWVKFEPKKKSFICCPIEKTPNPEHCNPPTTPFNYRDFSGYNDHTIPAIGHGCKCDDVEGQTAISSREKYMWKPSSCDLLKWNATQFCHLLGNQRMLLVGDSLMEQTATTLMSMIYEGT